MFESKCLPWMILIATSLIGRTIAVGADQSVRASLGTFLQRHCVECHAGDTPESGLNLETCSVDLTDGEVRSRWIDLYDRVAAGEMPPKSQTPLSADDRGRFLESLGTSLSRADVASRQVVLRRLNRNEYINTVSDLFGIYVDLRSTLPDDVVEQGFDTIGSGLSLSPEQMVLY
ncbi:MAG: DUF1587 domain-containing protein [Planctomycetaceae bacterium]